MNNIATNFSGLNLDQQTVEAYKALRTNVYFLMQNKAIKSIAVSSPNPGEGKTTTAINLAIFMTQLKLRILLVDADFRKPTIHQLINIPNESGLANIIINNRAYQTVRARIKGYSLDVITTGTRPANPSELLGSDSMKDFLAQVYSYYDLIILDTAPILPVTDTIMLSGFVDGLMLVVQYGKSTFENIASARDQLIKVNASILGIVVNKAKIEKSFNYQEYYLM